MDQVGRGAGRTATSSPPLWVPAVLLAAAVPGLLESLAFAWMSFVGNGPHADPSASPPPNIRFLDRADMWTQVGVGDLSALAGLAALAVLGWLTVSQPQGSAPGIRRLRKAGAVLAGVAALVQLSAPLTVATGWLLIATDPTAARDFSVSWPFEGLRLAAAVTFGLLAALLSWALWALPHHDVPAGDEPAVDEPTVVGPAPVEADVSAVTLLDPEPPAPSTAFTEPLRSSLPKTETVSQQVPAQPARGQPVRGCDEDPGAIFRRSGGRPVSLPPKREG